MLNKKTILIFIAFQLLIASYLLKKKDKKTKILPIDNCNLSLKECTFNIKNTNFIVSINPKPIKLLSVISINLKADKANKRDVFVEFIGVEMNMGLIKPKLNSNDDMNYQVKSMLNFCTESNMTWKVKIHILINEKAYLKSYLIKTKK